MPNFILASRDPFVVLSSVFPAQPKSSADQFRAAEDGLR